MSNEEREQLFNQGWDAAWRQVSRVMGVDYLIDDGNVFALDLRERDARVRREALADVETALAKYLEVHLFAAIDETMTQRQVIQFCVDQVRALAGEGTKETHNG